MQNTSLELVYRHNYEVEELVELTGQLGTEKHYYFPAAPERGGA
jgi:hypothetical protein